jgi:hypothetical protein
VLVRITTGHLAGNTDGAGAKARQLRLETPKEEMCEKEVSGTEYIESDIERKPVYYTIGHQ